MMTIVKTYALKAAIYQMIVQHPDFLAWAAAEYPALDDPTKLVKEVGSNSPSKDTIMPAICYRVVYNDPEKQPRRDIRLVTFDILAESNKNSTDELDELLDLMRDIFLDNDGRELGIFTEGSGYKDAVGATGEELSLMLWGVKEIARGEITPDPTFSTGSDQLLAMPNYHYGYVRMQMTVADARSIM